ncbi:hypothetical protein VTJ49DRAFT_2679 [Mycothermus thermophilus]|uniref:Uncharacterized protein n=1 Tax=Humicola insolens TaxID=85995 RepID=A0ABR3VA48_HUMIN
MMYTTGQKRPVPEGIVFGSPTAKRPCQVDDANQERAYIAASRRPNRDIYSRFESALRASETHFKRTGLYLHVTKECVIKGRTYQECPYDPNTKEAINAEIAAAQAENAGRPAAGLPEGLVIGFGAGTPKSPPSVSAVSPLPSPAFSDFSGLSMVTSPAMRAASASPVMREPSPIMPTTFGIPSVSSGQMFPTPLSMFGYPDAWPSTPTPSMPSYLGFGLNTPPASMFPSSPAPATSPVRAASPVPTVSPASTVSPTIPGPATPATVDDPTGLDLTIDLTWDDDVVSFGDIMDVDPQAQAIVNQPEPAKPLQVQEQPVQQPAQQLEQLVQQQQAELLKLGEQQYAQWQGLVEQHKALLQQVQQPEARQLLAQQQQAQQGQLAQQHQAQLEALAEQQRVQREQLAQKQQAQQQPVQYQPVQQQPVQHQPVQYQPVQHQPVQQQSLEEQQQAWLQRWKQQKQAQQEQPEDPQVREQREKEQREKEQREKEQREEEERQHKFYQEWNERLQYKTREPVGVIPTLRWRDEVNIRLANMWPKDQRKAVAQFYKEVEEWKKAGCPHKPCCKSDLKLPDPDYVGPSLADIWEAERKNAEEKEKKRKTALAMQRKLFKALGLDPYARVHLDPERARQIVFAANNHPASALKRLEQAFPQVDLTEDDDNEAVVETRWDPNGLKSRWLKRVCELLTMCKDNSRAAALLKALSPPARRDEAPAAREGGSSPLFSPRPSVSPVLPAPYPSPVAPLLSPSSEHGDDNVQMDGEELEKMLEEEFLEAPELEVTELVEEVAQAELQTTEEPQEEKKKKKGKKPAQKKPAQSKKAAQKKRKAQEEEEEEDTKEKEETQEEEEDLPEHLKQLEAEFGVMEEDEDDSEWFEVIYPE